MASIMHNQESPIRIVMVGAGGLAAGAAWGILSGWNDLPRLELLIIDPDIVEISNLNRQIFFRTEDIGKSKAECLAESLRQWPALHTGKTEILGRIGRLDLDSISALAGSASLLIDATDSTETKFLLNDFCVAHGIPYCYAGAVGFRGQLLFYNPAREEKQGCLRCLFGDFTEEDYREQSTTCKAAGIIGPVVGYAGLLESQEALKFIRASDAERATLGGELLRFQYPSFTLNRTRVEPDANCPLGCGLEKRSFLDLRAQRCPATFLYTKLALERLEHDVVLDVRFGSLDSTENVSRSVELEGHRLRGEARRLAEDEWQVLIEKRREETIGTTAA